MYNAEDFRWNYPYMPSTLAFFFCSVNMYIHTYRRLFSVYFSWEIQISFCFLCSSYFVVENKWNVLELFSSSFTFHWYCVVNKARLCKRIFLICLSSLMYINWNLSITLNRQYICYAFLYYVNEEKKVKIKQKSIWCIPSCTSKLLHTSW